jgi:isopenicillin N synthase-like dioxygenase
MESAVKPFVQKSLAVNDTLLAVLNDRLGLPKGAIARRHAPGAPSGSETRCIRTPPRPGLAADKATLGAHTDFGSLVCSILIIEWHSRLMSTLVIPS